MAADQEKLNKQALDKGKRLTQEQIVSGFNQLRQEQRALVSKCDELELELNEHSLVVDALKEVDGERKCYRMIGGVLVERTVKEVLPAVENNKAQLSKVIENLNQQIQNKGREINEYREKFNIQIRGEPVSTIAQLNKEQEPQSSSSVLVDSKS